MARNLDPFKLSSPRIFLVRMMVFLILAGLVVTVLYRQIIVAFMSNPGLNALIIAVLAIGILLAFRQVIRLFAEVSWVNSFRLADPGLAVARPPVLLAPMATILGERAGRMAISPTTMRGLMDSIATRLDEARDISRYMTSLLVFLGLLGTFWGLIETVGSVGSAMANLAEAIHGLVSHMRTEQQMIRDWADSQAAQGREMQRLLERIAGEEPRKDELRKTVR